MTAYMTVKDVQMIAQTRNKLLTAKDQYQWLTILKNINLDLSENKLQMIKQLNINNEAIKY